jgi:hypothetical protein
MLDEQLSSQEKYERMSVFYFLKNGKPLIRKGLAKRILFLALNKKCTTIRSQTVSVENFNRYSLLKVRLNDFEFKRLESYCLKYLTTYLLKRENSATGNLIGLYYKRECVRWDLLDHDLISLYPDNIVIRNNIPYILNYNVYIHPDYRINASPNFPEGGEENSPSNRT